MALVDWMSFATVCVILTILVFSWTKDSFEKELRREQKRFDTLVMTLVDLDKDYEHRDFLKREIENTNARIDLLKTMIRKKDR